MPDDVAGVGVFADAFSVDAGATDDFSVVADSTGFSAGAAAEESERAPAGEAESDLDGVANRWAGTPPTLIPANG
ncbi:hypothetical protein [Rhodococcus sp. KRD162]|uniref:hypothetical protein n=1 Tax=unclassified Rhodococcus (in: high G+C Gram-positive bacteria) TaxID=192944 RepID=UPI001F499CC6|nr:hypothetical protein [Rhodococcus sp. KRD162]